ncbi:NS3 [uncultured densovirus]|uniref:NS3 n=1 Tax=Asterias forbesi-associated densovirus TaxID=3071312 RepID=A0A6B9R1V7_9VIRU|nr:NS3 [uncultured densovirus]QHG62571.1 NS3 [Asterias forbesi-associated densovirus]
MNCVYGKDPCSCSKCDRCGLCTNGSQLHRSCFKDWGVTLMAEDEEMSELMAGAEESLPTAEEEETAIALQRDTPLSMQYEEMSTFENNLLFEQTYQFETCKTDVDIVFETLSKNYPDEDFNSSDFQRLDIHKYLTSEMTKLEFFIAHNQWDYEFAHYPKNIPVRMRKGVVTRFNNSEQQHNVYHMSCIDTEHSGFTAGGFTKGLLTVEARNVKEFFDIIIDSPEMFFCKYCEHYMFDCIEHYSGKAWEIPSEDIWPSCNYIIQSYMTDRTNEESYYTLHAHKIIAIVYPQEPPKKKVCRRLFDYDSDDTLPDLTIDE